MSVIVDGLYNRLENDTSLRPKFAGDLLRERDHQKKFFEEWLGGEPRYSHHIASRSLRQIHDHIHISRRDAEKWVNHVERSLEDAGVEAAASHELLDVLRPLALALANEPGEAGPGEHRCLRAKRGDWVARAAEKGLAETVQAAIDDDPQLLDDWADGMQTLLYRAASRGKLQVVAVLLEADANPNATSHSGNVRGAVTPLYAARKNRRRPVIDLLRAHGARDDIFTDAALGDLPAVERWLETDPDLAALSDPATDIFQITPLHAAVDAGHCDVARLIISRSDDLGRLSTLLVRAAADHDDIELVKLLVERNADATRIGAGRWVMNPALSELLVEHGADVEYAPHPWASWLWQSCTGNHNQSDDPAYVRAIIAQGVDVDQMRDWGRAALHFAAKAGFVQTVDVLLAAGANPNLRDLRNGETPLFYAFKGGKRADPRPIVSRLLNAGADPSVTNHRGRTVHQQHPKSQALLGEVIG